MRSQSRSLSVVPTKEVLKEDLSDEICNLEYSKDGESEHCGILNGMLHHEALVLEPNISSKDDDLHSAVLNQNFLWQRRQRVDFDCTSCLRYKKIERACTGNSEELLSIYNA